MVFALQHAAMAAISGRPELGGPFLRILAEQLASWSPCALLTPPVVVLTLRVRRLRRSTRRIASIHLAGAVLFASLAGSLMGLAEHAIPWEPDRGGLLHAAWWALLGYLGFNLLFYVLIVAGTEAAAHAWESRRRALTAAVYARQLAEARLHVLGAQLQPHFLFNALHAISALVWEDQARADRLLARLSELLRLTLSSNTRVETTLAEELALLRRYAEIQEARYGDRLSVGFEIDPRVESALVPRLILQPLVENAIRHGITRRISPGTVRVRAWAGEGRLHLAVEDDGVGLGEAVREGVGLSITRARLTQLYGREQRFVLEPGAERGAIARLSLPHRTGTATDTATGTTTGTASGTASGAADQGAMSLFPMVDASPAGHAGASTASTASAASVLS
ncbi:MAG TPA: histidine kinase [Gemmatimonadales bacterium]|nr:histidine kinase [Gemmatimonadales bacterium]